MASSPTWGCKSHRRRRVWNRYGHPGHRPLTHHPDVSDSTVQLGTQLSLSPLRIKGFVPATPFRRTLPDRIGCRFAVQSLDLRDRKGSSPLGGPNFGAINRAALICADDVVIPVAPDLFSIQGLRNLGPTLKSWRKEWSKRLSEKPIADIPLPVATMRPLGYVVLQFGIRDSRPVAAYGKWAKRIPSTFREKVLEEQPSNGAGVPEKDPNCLGLLKHYRSLMPMAMEARKPIFHLKSADGAIGAHTYAVKDCEKDFHELADRITAKIQTPVIPAA